MKRALITILVMLTYLYVNAQTDFQKGYIITTKGSDIHGSLKVQNDEQSSDHCIFDDHQGHIKRYEPGEIDGYRFDNGKLYVTRFVSGKHEGKPVFVEYLVKGKKSLYYYRDKEGFHYLLSYKNDTLIEIPFRKRSTVYVRDEGSYEAPPLQFGFLKVYFKDTPALEKDIDKITALNFNGLISLMKKYNQLVCGEPCDTVYYKIPSVKLAVELRGGIEHLKGLTLGRYLPTFGGLIYISLPRANQRIAFKTGLLFYEYPGKTTYPEIPRFDLFTIPLQFEYTVTRNPRFIPKFDFGVNYFMEHVPGYMGTDKMLTLAGGAGALIKVTKGVYFDISLDSNILAFRYDTELFYTYSLNGGVYVKL